LTREEREAILQAIIAGQKHFGEEPSLRSLAKIIQRDRYAIQKTAARSVAWVERLLANVQRADLDSCWIWVGGVSVRRRQLRDCVREIVTPRFMDGPNKEIHPARFMWELANGRELSSSQHLKQKCGNRLCVNYTHQHVPESNHHGEVQNAA
jgi:hypothetical protein